MNGGGLWDEVDGFYYDRLRLADGRVGPDPRAIHGRARPPGRVARGSPCGSGAAAGQFPGPGSVVAHRMREKTAAHTRHPRDRAQRVGPVATLVRTSPRLRRLFATMLNEEEFLSPYGLRSLSRYHRDHPFILVEPKSGRQFVLDYEPAESTTGQFGGNSNWRGPIWFPLNYLVIRSLRRLHAGLGDAFTVELPNSPHIMNSTDHRRISTRCAGNANAIAVSLIATSMDGRETTDSRQVTLGARQPESASARGA